MIRPLTQDETVRLRQNLWRIETGNYSAEENATMRRDAIMLGARLRRTSRNRRGNTCDTELYRGQYRDVIRHVRVLHHWPSEDVKRLIEHLAYLEVRLQHMKSA